MPHPRPDSEDALEQAAISLLAGLGWAETVNAYNEVHRPELATAPRPYLMAAWRLLRRKRLAVT